MEHVELIAGSTQRTQLLRALGMLRALSVLKETRAHGRQAEPDTVENGRNVVQVGGNVVDDVAHAKEVRECALLVEAGAVLLVAIDDCRNCDRVSRKRNHEGGPVTSRR